MKKKGLCAFIALSLVIPFLLAGCAERQDIPSAESKAVEFIADTVTEIPEIKKKGTVVILATGGTIAGAGKAGKETGYTSGAISVDSLGSAIPELEEIANIETIQICNANSDDITSEIWIQLANTINEMAKDENVTGFVVTHGTDTMEETAYFLDMVIKTDKPVVLTGSMRPATAISADGPMNLYQAVSVAVSEKSVGKGVLVVFSDRIFSARSVRKTSTYNVMAISAGEAGSIGVIRNKEVEYYGSPVKKHTAKTEFDIKDVSALPNVQILYFAIDADPGMLIYAAEHADGLVIAGAGAGEFSERYVNVISELTIPVVISSRVDEGIIMQDSVLCSNTVAANDLPAQKAAVLLRLAIMNKADTKDDLVRIFETY